MKEISNFAGPLAPVSSHDVKRVVRAKGVSVGQRSWEASVVIGTGDCLFVQSVLRPGHEALLHQANAAGSSRIQKFLLSLTVVILIERVVIGVLVSVVGLIHQAQPLQNGLKHTVLQGLE